MFETVLQGLRPFASEFANHGKELYLVGGAVRNLLLGRPVKDYDFTTNALPQEVQSYFRKVLPTGLQHGTVTVLFQGESYEVTTFRVDGGYSDGRRPDGVTYTASLEEDLKRRDFTINSLALNLFNGTLVDPHDGRGDLRRKLLRAIGDPGTRFDEDALRILRLFRFASQLGFSIDEDTLAAVPPRRARLGAVSRERIREELSKTLTGASPAPAWHQLQEMGFLGDLFAPLTPQPLSEAGLRQLVTLSPDLRWCFWLTLACGAQRPAWEEALKSLTFSNLDQNAALGPAKAWDWIDDELPVGVVAKAIVNAWGDRERINPGTEYLASVALVGCWEDRRGLVAELLRVRDSNEPIFLGDLCLGGRELLALGVAPGPQLGRILRELQKAVWGDPSLNSPEALRSLVPSLL